MSNVPGTPQAPVRRAERHLRKRAERIHRIQMAQNQNLSGGPPLAEPNLGAHVISSLLLPQNLDARSPALPFARDDAAHPVDGALLMAWRFAADELAE